jgi:hypothetical protein
MGEYPGFTVINPSGEAHDEGARFESHRWRTFHHEHASANGSQPTDKLQLKERVAEAQANVMRYS